MILVKSNISVHLVGIISLAHENQHLLFPDDDGVNDLLLIKQIQFYGKTEEII